MENIPRYHSNCTAVTHRTTQAPSKPYAFTQQSRMSSTPILRMLKNSYSILSSHRLRGYKPSEFFKRLPPSGHPSTMPHSLCKVLPILSPSMPLYGILYHTQGEFVNIYEEFFRDFSRAPTCRAARKTPYVLTACFSESCRKWSWEARRGIQSHADIYTVRYAT